MFAFYRNAPYLCTVHLTNSVMRSTERYIDQMALDYDDAQRREDQDRFAREYPHLLISGKTHVI